MVLIVAPFNSLITSLMLSRIFLHILYSELTKLNAADESQGIGSTEVTSC